MAFFSAQVGKSRKSLFGAPPATTPTPTPTPPSSEPRISIQDPPSDIVTAAPLLEQTPPVLNTPSKRPVSRDPSRDSSSRDGTPTNRDGFRDSSRDRGPRDSSSDASKPKTAPPGLAQPTQRAQHQQRHPQEQQQMDAQQALALKQQAQLKAQLNKRGDAQAAKNGSVNSLTRKAPQPLPDQHHLQQQQPLQKSLVVSSSSSTSIALPMDMARTNDVSGGSLGLVMYAAQMMTQKENEQTRKIDELTSELEKANIKNDNLHQQYSQLHHAIEELEHSQKLLKPALERAQRESKAATALAEEFEKYKTGVALRVRNMESSRSAIESELVSLRTSKQEAIAAQALSTASLKEISDANVLAKEVIKEKEMGIIQLQGKCSECEAKLAESKIQVSELIALREADREKLADAMQASIKLKADFDNVKTHLEFLQTTHASLKTDHAAAIATLQQTHASDLEALKREHVTHMDKQAETHKEALQSEKQELREEKKSAAETLNKVKELHDATISRLETKHSEKLAEVEAALKLQQAEVVRRADLMCSVETQAAVFKGKVGELEMRVEQLLQIQQLGGVEADARKVQIAGLKADVERLQAEVAAKEETISVIKKDATKKYEQAVADHTSALAAKEQSIVALNKQLDNLTSDCTQKQAEISAMQLELVALKEKLGTCTESLDRSEKQIQENETRHAEERMKLQQKLKKCEVEIAEALHRKLKLELAAAVQQHEVLTNAGDTGRQTLVNRLKDLEMRQTETQTALENEVTRTAGLLEKKALLNQALDAIKVKLEAETALAIEKETEKELLEQQLALKSLDCIEKGEENLQLKSECDAKEMALQELKLQMEQVEAAAKEQSSAERDRFDHKLCEASSLSVAQEEIIQKLRTESECGKQENAKLRQDLASQTKQLNQSRIMLDDLKSKQSNAESLETQLRDNKIEVVHLKNLLESSDSKLKKANDDLAAIRAELKETKRSILTSEFQAASVLNLPPLKPVDVLPEVSKLVGATPPRSSAQPPTNTASDYASPFPHTAWVPPSAQKGMKPLTPATKQPRLSAVSKKQGFEDELAVTSSQMDGGLGRHLEEADGARAKKRSKKGDAPPKYSLTAQQSASSNKNTGRAAKKPALQMSQHSTNHAEYDWSASQSIPAKVWPPAKNASAPKSSIHGSGYLLSQQDGGSKGLSQSAGLSRGSSRRRSIALEPLVADDVEDIDFDVFNAPV
ncbi:hypothetical protein HDU81_000836 [Chytriomyces hyalinus]|nr:hypothetical protein HDU81_000836 [Chytriomyces hyalinus]